MSAEKFALEIARAFDDMMDEAGEFVQMIGLEAHQRITMRTPVDEGTARANWLVAIGDVLSEEPIDERDTSGNATLARGRSVIESYSTRNGFSEIAIFNNVDYIEYLENGSSEQARAGMVAVTVAELQAEFNL